jgi:hypothetical protein
MSTASMDTLLSQTPFLLPRPLSEQRRLLVVNLAWAAGYSGRELADAIAQVQCTIRRDPYADSAMLCAVVRQHRLGRQAHEREERRNGGQWR